jgi:hypothetical protein
MPEEKERRDIGRRQHGSSDRRHCVVMYVKASAPPPFSFFFSPAPQTAVSFGVVTIWTQPMAAQKRRTPPAVEDDIFSCSLLQQKP